MDEIKAPEVQSSVISVPRVVRGSVPVEKAAPTIKEVEPVAVVSKSEEKPEAVKSEVLKDKEVIDPAEKKVEKVEKDEKADDKDAKPEEKAEKTEKESARWAALAKQERKLELEKSAFKTESAEKLKQWEADKKYVEEFKTEVESIKSPKTALKFLNKLGIEFTALAEYFLNPDVVEKDFEEKNFRKQYEKDKLERERVEKENLTKQQEQNIKAYKQTIVDLIDTDGDNSAFPLIRANNEYDLVYQVMDEQFRKDGTEMDKKEAARMVESFLQDKLDKQIKAKKLSVVSASESNSKPEIKEEQVIKAKPTSQKAIATEVTKPNLTDLRNSTVVSNPRTRHLSDQERIKRGVAAYESALKK